MRPLLFVGVVFLLVGLLAPLWTRWLDDHGYGPAHPVNAELQRLKDRYGLD